MNRITFDTVFNKRACYFWLMPILLIHVFSLIGGVALGYPLYSVINVLSVIVYLFCFLLIKQEKYYEFCNAILLEVTYYVVCCVAIFGWGAEFQEWIFMLMLFTFFMAMALYKDGHSMNRGLRAIVGLAAIFLVLYVISLLVEPFYELERLELLAFRAINHVITAAVMITLLWYCGRIMTRINTAWGEEEIIDHATGLYNRQYVYQLIHTAGEDHRVNGTNYAIVITDIDQLKKINENYGYAIGDKVVLRVAEILKDTKTEDNVTGIWDNGKFVTLLKFRGTLESLYLMIQEMNRKIGMSEIMLEDGKPIYATATIGIGTLKSELTTDEVIRRTEERVASGKKQGGDRVIWGNLLK